MSRNSGGTYSLPTGNPVVNGTTIDPTVHNNTLSDIATELTNSLDRGGRGAMTAPIQVVGGSASAPGVGFDGDSNTGLYRVGADNPAIAAGGTKIQDWTTALTSIANNVALTGSDPASTTGFTDTLTPKNLIKAWGRVSANGSGSVTLSDGFNVASVALTGGNIGVTFATAMANATYAVIANLDDLGGGGADYNVHPSGQGTTSFTLNTRKTDGTQRNAATSAVIVHFLVLGTM